MGFLQQPLLGRLLQFIAGRRDLANAVQTAVHHADETEPLHRLDGIEDCTGLMCEYVPDGERKPHAETLISAVFVLLAERLAFRERQQWPLLGERVLKSRHAVKIGSAGELLYAIDETLGRFPHGECVIAVSHQVVGDRRFGVQIPEREHE